MSATAIHLAATLRSDLLMEAWILSVLKESDGDLCNSVSVHGAVQRGRERKAPWADSLGSEEGDGSDGVPSLDS